jgi:hypothetical protein
MECRLAKSADFAGVRVAPATNWTSLLLPCTLATRFCPQVPRPTIAARRDGNLPWYWDVLFLGMGGLFLLGVIREDTGMMFVGLVSSSAVIAAVVVAVWIFERRYGVRIYSKARGFVIVNEVKAS